MSILSGLVGLVNLAMFIIVLIKLFQKEGALKGVLGLICALYTFIWGWMKPDTLGNARPAQIFPQPTRNQRFIFAMSIR